MLIFIGLFLIAAAVGWSSTISFLTKTLGSLREPLQIWEALQGVGFLPIRLRAWIFSSIVGLANPYARTIHFRVTELRRGKACGVLKETKESSNPFQCVHAAALITFGETIGSLALLTLLQKQDQVQLTNINAEYLKVSHGLLTGSSVVLPIKNRDAKEMTTQVLIKNSTFETVVKLTLTWQMELKD